ncbi:MAG: TRAP transporter large permease subunit [Deltaproteobacteria bacterium]|nr:TRAP transporter large permease subunit [Deltaproteobacteria bacterium]
MSPFITGIIGIALTLVLLLLGVPIGISMALVGFVGFAFIVNMNAAFSVISTVPYELISNYDWLVLPLFLLMGTVLFHAGLGSALFKMAYRIFGRLPGGLAIAALGSCAIFAAVSASSIATAATIGTPAIPEMRRYKYDSALATGCIAAGGTLGFLIPPSTILIIYGILTETSIVKLFVAGIVPGIILALMFMATVYFHVRLRPSLAPAGQGSTLKEKLTATGECAEVLVLIILVMGGLIIGWFTPTEAGGVAAAGAILLSLVRKRLNMKSLTNSVVDAVKSTGMIFLCAIGAFIMVPFIAVSTIPMELANYIISLGVSPTMAILFMVVLYFILGCFIDTMAMVLLTVPIFFPLIKMLGFDPLWFGILIALLVEMAMISPPIGMNVYVIAGVAKDVPMETIFKGILPFVLTMFLFIILIIVFPQIVLFLPRLMS